MMANAGVPMVFVTMPGMALALIPIVVLEAFVLARRLRLGWWPCASCSIACNLVSTFAGMPLVWIVLVAGQLLSGGGEAYGLDSRWHRFLAVTWQAPWLIPYESDLWWMVPRAMLVLLVPFFLASVLVEYHVARRMLPTIDGPILKSGVLAANALSYAGLALVVGAMIVLAGP